MLLQLTSEKVKEKKNKHYQLFQTLTVDNMHYSPLKHQTLQVSNKGYNFSVIYTLDSRQ
jgi:hypothetical protein